MLKFSDTTNNYLAIGMVFAMILFVYMASNALTAAAADEPKACTESSLYINHVCLNRDRSSIANFHETLDMDLQNGMVDVNGFSIRVLGEKGATPLVLFNTVKAGQESVISAPYEEDITGSVKRIEIKPIINRNQNIYHCSLDHGIVIEQEIGSC
jgi:hypothetical protein